MTANIRTLPVYEFFGKIISLAPVLLIAQFQRSCCERTSRLRSSSLMRSRNISS